MNFSQELFLNLSEAMQKPPLLQYFLKPSRYLVALGIIGMMLGAFLFLLAPLELITFSYFSEGGRFHYDGFGVGSFMGLTITAQIVVYYLLGMAGLVIGYGHIHLRSWIRPITLALLYTWLIIGAPVCVVAFFILAGTKDLSMTSGMVALVGLVVCYSLLPVFLIRLYNSEKLRIALITADPNPGWLASLPVPIITITCMEVILIIIFNLLILCNGIFPMFGWWLSGLPGVIGLVACIGLSALLIWGILQRSKWAWWGILLLVGLFGLSSIITFSLSSYPDILAVMNFPPYEINILKGIPARGYHFAILSGLPLVLTWMMAFRSRKYFIK